MLLKNVLLFVFNTFQFFLCLANIRDEILISTLFPHLQYPESYRDHIYRGLSENGKQLFYAIKIHPECAAKHGICMRRGQCIQKEMLYLSRVCYVRDLVCCYDKYTKPLVASRSRPDNSTEYNGTIIEIPDNYNYTAMEGYNVDEEEDLLRFRDVNISDYDDMFTVGNSTNNMSSSLNTIKDNKNTLTTPLVVVKNTSV